MKILILGGTGFLSGAMVRMALAAGHEVSALSRGMRKAQEHAVRWLVSDRNDEAAFARALDGMPPFDLVVDCIGFSAAHAQQDVATFFSMHGSARTGHLVFISTDFVCSPVDRPWKIDETFDRFVEGGYGGGKRAAEEVLLAAARERKLPITILRPCHIYGPGSLLGCLPRHGRDAELLKRIERGETLKLVCDGQFLQQPVYAEDVAAMALSCAGNRLAEGQIYFAAGPEILTSREYYRLIGELIGAPAKIEEASMTEYLNEKPDSRSFFCHRVYEMAKARSHGLTLPAMDLREGLQRQVEALRGK
jgi:nucleoside-diphosphate-sugar epimerase